jgi:hypothetical protein
MEVGRTQAFVALKHFQQIHFLTCLANMVRIMEWSRWVLDYGRAQNQLGNQAGIVR